MEAQVRVVDEQLLAITDDDAARLVLRTQHSLGDPPSEADAAWWWRRIPRSGLARREFDASAHWPPSKGF